MKDTSWYVLVDAGKYPCTTLGTRPDINVLNKASLGMKVGLDTDVIYKYVLDKDYPGNLTSIYSDQNLFLLADKLVETLQKAGVNNLEIFKASIEDPTTNKIYTNYKLVNVLGSVDAINQNDSMTFEKTMGERVDPVFGPLGYDTLAVNADESVKSGLLLFRLKGSGHTLIAHISLKKAFTEAGIDDVEFIEPEDWAGA